MQDALSLSPDPLSFAENFTVDPPRGPTSTPRAEPSARRYRWLHAKARTRFWLLARLYPAPRQGGKDRFTSSRARMQKTRDVNGDGRRSEAVWPFGGLRYGSRKTRKTSGASG